MITPFKPDGSVDEKALRRFVDFQIDGGVDMLLPCGTTGEGATLDEPETDRVVQIVIEQSKGRVPVIAGAGSNSTAKAVQMTKRAKKLGAGGVLSVGPYYNKPTQQGYYEHFKAIAEADDIPVVVYNVPGRTGGNIEANTMLRLAEIRNIVAVKDSSLLYSANFSLGMNYFFRIVRRAAEMMNNAVDYDPYVHEIHHRQKVDSPSGTALQLAHILVDAMDRKKEILVQPPKGKIGPEMLHVTSTRAGVVAGTHTIGFDSEADLIELTHVAKTRRGFALGALTAARWLKGRKGIYTMDDVEL